MFKLIHIFTTAFEILTNLIIFKLYLHFLEFSNHLDTRSWSQGRIQQWGGWSSSPLPQVQPWSPSSIFEKKEGRRTEKRREEEEEE
jgi:hypothetical protein